MKQQKELSNTQDNTTSSNEEIVIYKEITGTPFTMVTTENGSKITLGRYVLSRDFATTEEAETDGQRNDWDRIMQVIGVMIENYNEKIKI